MVGSLVGKCAKNFFVDKLFIGTDGFSEKAGFTGTDLPRVEAVQLMAEQAKNVIILTDSSKFQQHGVLSLLPLNKISTVITDEGIPLKREHFLSQNSIQVLKVSKEG